MAKSLKDNLRMAMLSRAQSDQAARARMDALDVLDASGKKEEVRPGLTRSDQDNPGQTKTDQDRPGPSRSDLLVRPGLTSINNDRPDLTRSDHTSKATPSIKSDLVRPGLTRMARQQRAVLRYVEEIQEKVVSTKVLSRLLEIPVPTLYKVIRLLRERGHIEAAREGNEGTYLKFIGWDMVRPGLTKSDLEDQHSGQTRSDTVRPGLTVSDRSKKIDRKENLSISSERITITWPNLAAAGFGMPQLEQIQHALEELGKPTDKLIQSLDHAEWELENGKMTDKAGMTVSDPCSWVFRSLARTGYYRKPSGYVSPEEQALLDETEKAKAIQAARQALETAQFEAWRAGLTPQDLEVLMRGFPGGSKDQWLKTQWKQLSPTSHESS